jgi:hypothetical protein
MAFWSAALCSSVLYFIAAVSTLIPITQWQPEADDRLQLQRERRIYTASLLGRWSFVGILAAAMIGLSGIAVAWPSIVPGAMCGTGVMQAMAPFGLEAMVYWGIAIFVLYAWHVLDGLNAATPQTVLTPYCGRLFLVAGPVILLAVMQSWQAMMQVDTVAVVDCCAAVYDRVFDAHGAAVHGQGRQSLWMMGSLAGGFVIIVTALHQRLRPARTRGYRLLLMVMLWGVAALVSLKYGWSAYYYQVLSHDCLWCLLLPEHHFAGFALLGALFVGLAQALRHALADWSGRRFPRLDAAAARVRRQATLLIALSVATFMSLSVSPALVWRIQTGTWLTGTP